MANPNPPEANRWKKGQSGNPSGIRKLPVDLRKVSDLTTRELSRVISKHLRMTRNELSKIRTDPKAPALDLIIVSAIESSIKYGDTAKAEYLFMRILGKVTDKAEIILPEPFIIQTKDGARINMGAKFEGQTIETEVKHPKETRILQAGSKRVEYPIDGDVSAL